MRRTALRSAPIWAAFALPLFLSTTSVAAKANDTKPVETSFEEALPADSYLAFTISGLDELGRHVDQLALHAIWSEDEVSGFFADAIAQLTEHLEELKEHARPSPISLTELRKLLGGRIGLALGGLTTLQYTPTPAVLLTIEVPQDRQPGFLGLLNQVLDQMPGSQELVRGELEHRGVRFSTLGHEEVHGEVLFGFDGELFVAGIGRSYLTDFVDARHGEASGDRLVDVPAFQRARSKALSEGSLAWLYLNVDAFRERLGGLVPDTYQRMLSDLGLDRVHGFAFALNRQGSGSRTTLYLDSPGEKRGVMKLLAPGRIEASRLGHVPENAVLYATAHYDGAAIYGEVMGLVDRAASEYLPRRQAEQLRRELEAALRMLPIDPQKDVLQPLGAMSEIYVALPTTGGLIPDVVLTLDVRDPERLQETIEQGLGMLDGVEVRQTTYQERTIHYATIRQPDFTLQPAFVLTDDKLMIASQVLVLKRAIQWQSSEETKTLAQTEGFQRALESLEGRPGELLYLNLPDVFRFAYSAASPVLSSVIDPNRMPFDAALLPSTESIAQHLTGVVMSYAADDEGLLFESVSPIGLAALIECAMASVHWAIDQGYGDALMSQAIASAHGGGPGIGAPTPIDHFSRAQSLQNAGDHAAAIEVYTQALAQGDRGGAIFFQRGYCHHVVGNYDAARADFQRSIESGYAVDSATYNIACGHALKGETEAALDWLQKALQAGFDREDLLRDDSDLDSIRGEAQFREMLKRRGID